ncbi:hypothetical protein ACTFIW_000764 [Dictyostelium discoideum]
MNALHLDWGQWKQYLAFPPPILLAFYPGEYELIQFEEGFYNTDLPIWRSATWYPMIQAQFPRHHRHMFPQVLGTFQEVLTKQSSSTAELLMKSWETSTLKVYSSNYTRFRNFCTSNSLNPANITLFVFMDYFSLLIF